MPSYDYRCTRCNTIFEARHSIDADAPPCPGCNAKTERLILSPPAVHGFQARGREQAMRSLPECGRGCSCCPPRPDSGKPAAYSTKTTAMW